MTFLLRTRNERPEPRSLVFEHALSLALDAADEREGVVELVALASGDRATIESARYRFLGLLDSDPNDLDLRNAVQLLDKAVRHGTQRGLFATTR